MRTKTIVGVLAVIIMSSLAAHAAEVPGTQPGPGALSFGIQGGLGLPAGKLGQEITESTMSSTDVGLPAGQAAAGHFGGFFDYFVNKDLAIGADLGYLSTKGKDIAGLSGVSLFTSRTFQFGVHGKYFLPVQGQVFPYMSLGFGLYSRKLEFTDLGAAVMQQTIDEMVGPGYVLTTSYSDTKPGMNIGAGVDFQLNEMVRLGANGAYHQAFGELKGPPVIGASEEAILKDWTYMAFNVALTFHVPRK